ncbi:MAG: hypothetical protein H0X24_22260 [Ktedonobacterales bacterium]|nr:hypothetical protein [Ktedonobacterales bacterium]
MNIRIVWSSLCPKRLGIWVALLAIVILISPVVSQLAAEDREFTPALAEKFGFIDVTKAPYGAKPDGITDCTVALQRAIGDCATPQGGTIYLPAGTYVVRERVAWRRSNGEWRCWVGLQGQARGKTVIQLANNCPGFSDADHPRGVLHLAAGWLSDNGPDSQGDGRNDAYHNNVRDLTIDVGRSNPGAIGIDWMATNQGVIDSVTVRSVDQTSGHAGIAMIRRWPGPGLIRNTIVEGCRYGFVIMHGSQSATIEGLTLRHQREAGILCDLNCLSIRRLVSDNRVPAIRLTSSFPADWGRFPQIVLVDAELGGGDPTMPAIDNRKGYLVLRGVRTAGYRCAVEDRGTDVPTLPHEWTSDTPLGVFSNAGRTLDLEVKETPDWLERDPAQWESIADHGAVSNDDKDDTAAIQAAIDAGKSSVCFPGGVYHVRDTIRIHGPVRTLFMANSIVMPLPGGGFGDKLHPRAVFRIEDPTPDLPGVIIERFEMRMGNEAPGAILFEHASPKPLTLRNAMPHAGTAPYRGLPGCGELFLEDCANHTHNQASWIFQGPQHIWARQLNPELVATNIINRGAHLWILGLKTEDGATNIATERGGTTELLGALLYPAGRAPPNGTPAFTCIDSRMSLSWVLCDNPGGPYPIWVQETRGRETRELLTPALPDGRHRAVPLYAGWRTTDK